jgi:hypothetical protein
VDHRVLGIESDRLVAISHGAAELVCVPPGERANEVNGWRPGIQSDCGARVLDLPIKVALASPVLAAEVRVGSSRMASLESAIARS